MTDSHPKERAVIVHTAGTLAEAMVIRALLESANIHSWGSAISDPFPLREPPEGMPGVEIVVLESQEDEARRIIADHLQDNSIAPESEA